MAGVPSIMSVPNLQDLQQYSVNVANNVEGIKASLYDFTTYAQAGQTQLDFFQVPQGQAGKSLADTNMEAAGSLPNPKSFLVTNIQCYVFPNPAISILGADAVATGLNDIQIIGQGGWLEFFIGSKNYIQEGPILRFPPRNGLIINSSQDSQTTPAAGLQTMNAYGNLGGEPYDMKPPILLNPTQNFRVSLKWPVGLAISHSCRIGIVMEGLLYRLSQ